MGEEYSQPKGMCIKTDQQKLCVLSPLTLCGTVLWCCVWCVCMQNTTLTLVYYKSIQCTNSIDVVCSIAMFNNTCTLTISIAV